MGKRICSNQDLRVSAKGISSSVVGSRASSANGAVVRAALAFRTFSKCINYLNDVMQANSEFVHVIMECHTKTFTTFSPWAIESLKILKQKPPSLRCNKSSEELLL